MQGITRPHDRGVCLAVLGPDGAGKSTVLKLLAEDLQASYAPVRTWHFSPPLLARRKAPTTDPDGQIPRSRAASWIKLSYWVIQFTAGYLASVRPILNRGGIVLFDRYLVDALVDPKRYRYSGPMSLLRLAWRAIPKPDLLVLLDAPPEVLRARKQELTVEETARQRDAYRRLVLGDSRGRIVDASSPVEKVLEDVKGLVIERSGVDGSGSER